MEVMYDVFTKEGEYLGTRPASVCCEGENPVFYYKLVWTILLNENNEILLQKRSTNLRRYPGRWEFSSSGHVDLGENELDACVREAKEELGISLSKDNIRLVKMWVHRNALAYTYIARIKNDTKFNLQKDEVDEVKYVSLYEFKQLIYTDNFVNRQKDYYEFLLDYLINTMKIDDRDLIKREVNENDLVKSMDSINEDENVKEGLELEGSLKIIDIIITLLLCLLVGIVVYCIIKL